MKQSYTFGYYECVYKRLLGTTFSSYLLDSLPSEFREVSLNMSHFFSFYAGFKSVCL